MSTDAKFLILQIFLTIGIVILFMVGFNSFFASDWNGGICPKCEMRYELRGVSHGVKYYVCPNCGDEIEKY